MDMNPEMMAITHITTPNSAGKEVYTLSLSPSTVPYLLQLLETLRDTTVDTIVKEKKIHTTEPKTPPVEHKTPIPPEPLTPSYRPSHFPMPVSQKPALIDPPMLDVANLKLQEFVTQQSDEMRRIEKLKEEQRQAAVSKLDFRQPRAAAAAAARSLPGSVPPSSNQKQNDHDYSF